ncbi:hypothetical protein [Streptomyces californicus]|uniref:hypothetical protein n=1 Tax=Streptomyces californicus TaxID=67351 RepID=UPI00378D3308
MDVAPDKAAVTCENTGEMPRRGWADRCRTGTQAREAPGGLVIVVVNLSSRSFLHARRRGCRSSYPSGWKRLIAEISIEKALDEEPIYCAFM